MEPMYYIGLDVRKRTISYCVKDVIGRVYGRLRSRHPLRSRSMDENTVAAVERGDGSHDVHRLDLRSSETARRSTEGDASLDAARHCCREKEE
jgi:hypothetical protein